MEQQYERGRRTVYPCQSTGLWLARATPAVAAFFREMSDYLIERPAEWEHKSYQLLVVRFLIGLGDDLPPIRYRLLPTSSYVNAEFYEARRRQGLPIDRTVGVHCGYLKEEGDKFEYLERFGWLQRSLERQRRMARLLLNRNAAAEQRMLTFSAPRRHRPPMNVTVPWFGEF